MILFNELRMTDDKSRLIIDCHIEGLDIYKDMYIKNIYVDYYGNREVTLPSARCVKVYENADDEGNPVTTVQAVRVNLDLSDAVRKQFIISTFAGGLFYVTVECDGTVPATVSTMPCGYDTSVDYGVIVDWEMLYTLGMRHATTYNFGCGACGDDDFETFVLMWNSIKLAVQSCDFTVMERFWEKFIRAFAVTDTAVTSSVCGCSSKN